MQLPLTTGTLLLLTLLTHATAAKPASPTKGIDTAADAADANQDASSSTQSDNNIGDVVTSALSNIPFASSAISDATLASSAISQYVTNSDARSALSSAGSVASVVRVIFLGLRGLGLGVLLTVYRLRVDRRMELWRVCFRVW